MRSFEALAAELDGAALAGRLVTMEPGLSKVDAYRTQGLLLERQLARGARLIGRKLGLTSEAKRRQTGVEVAVHGFLTDAMLIAGTLRADAFVQPRVEPEIAFTLGAPLQRADAEQARAAIAGVCGALEILDSRYEAFSFDLGAVVADNTSAAGVVVGPPVSEVDLAALDIEGVVLELDGEVAATATGAATMGHPVRALTWLSHQLDLHAGDLVMTGGLTDALSLDGVETIRATFTALPAVEVSVLR